MELQEKDTLELIQRTAQEANGANGKVVVIDLPREPDGVYGIVRANGEYERVVAQRPPRKQTLGSLDQVPLYVADAMTRLEGNDAPVVWYNRQGVVVLLSDAELTSDLRPRGVLSFKESEELLFLRELAKAPQWLLPKDFLRMLRLRLGQCLVDRSPDLIKQLRSLRWNSNSSGRSDVGPGKSTLGRDLEEEVRSELGQLPETVELLVRVIDDPSLKVRRSIRCVLEADAANGHLCLFPEAGQVTKAVDEEMQSIGELLRDGCNGTPVFHGET